MSVICLNCEAMGSVGCHLCQSERVAAKGGEQGPTPLEVELEGLRERVARLEAGNELLAEMRKAAHSPEARAEMVRRLLAKAGWRP